jgi:phosphoglucosamine mutase
MSQKLFGTDGIRGRANQGAMTAEMALKIAMATAVAARPQGHQPKVVIGKDTRLSGYLLEPALTAGFIGMGWDVILVGPLPTPAIAMLTRSLRADLGVMISASHNPFADNGIKLFGPDGYKLPEATEAEIEGLVAETFSARLAPAEKLGRASRLDDASGRYIEYVKQTFPKGLRLDGLKVAVDCAHGAAYKVAPRILAELGAAVVPIGIDPNGTNINKHCGATDLAALQETVARHGCDLGIALDGDADRLIMCDERAQVIDGDQLMGLIARAYAEKGLLKGKGLVATVMSNLGLERFAASIGLHLARVAVGDKNVVEHMRAQGYNVGGEQSGHLVLGDYATTGDGLIAALQVLAVIVEAQEGLAQDGAAAMGEGLRVPASMVARVFDPVPQVLQNVRYKNPATANAPELQEAIRRSETRLGAQGRILVRKSGTEPLIRVMAEGDDAQLVADVVAELCQVVDGLDRR